MTTSNCSPCSTPSSGSGPIIVSASKYGSVQDELGKCKALKPLENSLMFHGTGKNPVSWKNGALGNRIVLDKLLPQEGGNFRGIVALDGGHGLINASPKESEGKQHLVSEAGSLGWERVGASSHCFDEDLIQEPDGDVFVAGFSKCGPDHLHCLVRLPEGQCGSLNSEGQFVDTNPAGSMTMWAGVASKVPTGWLLCDGRIEDPAVYPKLFEKIGYFYGQDGSNFRVPDLRGVVPRGVDKSGVRDPNNTSRVAMYPGGNAVENVGSYQDDALQCHEHTNGASSVSTSNTTIGDGGSDVIKYPTTVTNIPTTTALVASSCGTPRTSNETRMKNIYLHYIISVGC